MVDKVLTSGRYNPGMNMTEEEKQRLTARRVGMEMPVEYDGKKE